MLKDLNRFALLATIALVYMLSSAAVAEDGPEQEQQKKSKLSADEIVVTARKRQESLQEVPLSISAFTAEKLEQVGAFDNEDVALLTPNFNTERQVGRRLDRPTIRGQAAPSTGAAPNASYFVDGAFVSGSIQTLTLGPIERVEILRGPQSAQFGRATFAGAVNYITRKPTNEFTGQMKTNVASHDSATVSGWASGPLVQDSLYYFTSISWDTYGGEYRNSLKDGQAPVHLAAPLTAPQRGDNSRLGGTDTKDIAAKFLWTPTDTTEVTFKASYTKGDDDHWVQVLQENGELNCFLPTIGNPGTADNSGEVWFGTSPGAYCGTLDPDRVTYFAGNPFNPNNASFNVAAFPQPEAYEPGFLFPPIPGVMAGIAYTLPAEGAPRQARINLPDFYDGIMGNPGCLGSLVPADCIAAPAQPGTRRDTTRLLVQWDQDIGDWTWLTRVAWNKDDFDQVYDLDRTERRPILGVGLFHMVENAAWENQSLESRIESPGDRRLRGILGVNYFEEDRTSNQRRFPGPGQGQFSPIPLTQNIKNIAVFGSLNYDISDALEFSSELRWAEEKRDIDAGATCDAGEDPGGLYTQYYGQSNTGKSTIKALSPRFILRYEPDDSTMYYVSAAKGDKPAEFVTAYFRTTANQCESIAENNKPNFGLTVIKPEKAWTYEFGAKKTWMDRRLTTNYAVYYINWKNQAVSQNENIGGTLTQINVNSGKSKIWGAELETSFLFTENLTGQFSYGLANGTFREYYDLALADLTGEGDANGKRIPGAPKHSFIFGLDYVNEITLNVFDGPEVFEWFARTDFVLETERYAEADNFLKYPNRKRWNGRLGLESADWTLATYINNILDDRTPTGIFGFPVITGPAWSNAVGLHQNSISPAFGRAYGIEYVYRFGD